MKCAFENEQVMGKTRLIKSENKVPISVITSHAVFSIHEHDLIENEVRFCPRVWFFQSLSDKVKAQEMLF